MKFGHNKETEKDIIEVLWTCRLIRFDHITHTRMTDSVIYVFTAIQMVTII